MGPPNLVDCVIHWKKKLDKNPDDEEIILNVIRKLSKIRITPEILEATHIGGTIRNLAKRNDTVGENAKTLLSKWRKIFINLKSDRNSKHKDISNKDHKDKYPSKQSFTQVKTAGHDERESSHELKEKHKKSSSKQSSEKHHNANSSSKSNQSFVESGMKYLNDHQSIETSIASNTDSPKTHLLDDKRKISSSNDCHEMSSLKRKLTTEEKVEIYKNSLPKKIKLENHSSLHNEVKEKHKSAKGIINKAESSSQNLKKEQSSSSHSKKEKYDKSEAKFESDKSRSKVKSQSSDGFTSSSVSFEDCLGFSDVAPVKKKKSSKSQSSTKELPSNSTQDKQKVTGNSFNTKVIDNVKASKKSSHSSKEKLSGSVLKKSTMFNASEVSPPSHSNVQSSFTMSQNQSSYKTKKESLTNEDVIKFTSSRKEKTAIYSGRKSCNKTFPSLAQYCYRVLIENIDILGPMADTPYKLLKPILEKCTPNQLFQIEKYNPHLLYDTNELWEIHCKRDYKLLSPLEHETWRDVYLRGFDEREEKLRHITANISASMSKATPVRQVKLAFIDSFVKPPREVLRRQAKHRLLESATSVEKPAVMPKVNVKKVDNVSRSAPSSQSFAADEKDIVKANESLQSETSNQNQSTKGNSKYIVAPVVDSTVSNKDIIALSLAARKPKVAPLMAKTLKAMKQCFRR